MPSYSKATPNNLNFISTFTTVEICLMAIYLSYTISEASATSYAKFQHFVVLHWWISGSSDCHFANCLVFLQASKDRWRPFFCYFRFLCRKCLNLFNKRVESKSRNIFIRITCVRPKMPIVEFFRICIWYHHYYFHYC